MCRLLLLAALSFLAACGPGAVTQTNKTERYTVQFSVDKPTIGARVFTIGVNDASGAPVTADQVVVAPVMREMGMASPEMVATPAGAGRYTAQGDSFSMLGEWQIEVRITAGGQDDTTTFIVMVQ
jgi:hypothetical protein